MITSFTALHRATRFALLAVGILLGQQWLGAASITARLEPPTARPNQVVTFILEIEGASVDEAPQLRFPLQVAQATAMSTQQSIQIRNGVQSSSVRLMWGVVASEPGDFVIPAQRVRAGGQELVSNEVPFKVDSSTGPQTQDDSQLPILQLELPKREVYQGEVVPLVASLYVPRQVILRRIGLIETEKSDFAIARFPQMGEQSTTIIDNVAYLVMSFRSTLSSLREGDLKLGPASTEVLVDVPTADAGNRGRLNSPFGNFPPGLFADMTEPRKLRVASQTINVKVLPLPQEGRPQSFSGAVGEFSIQASATTTELAVGDPISVEIEVAGSGNFDALPNPQLTETAGWKLYPAKRYVIEGPTDQNQIPTLERRIGYTQVLVAQAIHKQVPAFEISYFSPAQKKYVVLRTQPIALNMKPAALVAQAPVDSPPGAPAQAAAGPAPILPIVDVSDIVLAMPASAQWRVRQQGAALWDQRWFWWLQSLPLSALLLSFGFNRWQRSRQKRWAGPAGAVRKRWSAVQGSRSQEAAEFLREVAALCHEARLSAQGEPLLQGALDDHDALRFGQRQAAGEQWGQARRRELIQVLKRMLRKAAWLCVVLGLSLPPEASAAEPASPAAVYEQCLRELKAGQWLKAQHAAESLLKREPPALSAAIMEVIGHSRYKQGDLGRAALWYQRALLLGNPSRELTQNWRHLQERSRLLSFEGDLPAERLSRLAPRSCWLWFGSLLWWFSAGVVCLSLVGLLSLKPRWRAALGLGAVLGLLCFGLAWLTVPAEDRVRDVQVVVLPDVSAHTAASELSGTVTSLPPGSQVRVLERRGSWSYVRIPAPGEELVGWVDAQALTTLWPYADGWLPR